MSGIDPAAHFGLAAACARRFIGRGLAPEELRQQALLGLTLAAKRFDDTRGVAFSTFAVPTILGELRRACQRACAAHVPRTDRARLSALDKARASLIERLAREPTLPELAAALGCSPAELTLLLEAREAAYAPRATLEDCERILVQPSFEDALLLRQSIAHLPPIQARVLGLRAEGRLSQQQAARVLGLSQSRVSRIEAEAKAALRAILRE